MTHIDIARLREIAEVEYPDIVVETIIPDINELRIIFNDGSFVDVWYSCLYCKKPMTEMSAGIYGGGGFATTPIYSGGNTCTVVFSVESFIETGWSLQLSLGTAGNG